MAALTSTFWSSLSARDFAQLRASAQLPQVVAVLPGSREGEVSRLAAPFAGACAWLASHRPTTRFVAPMVNAAVRARFPALTAHHRRFAALGLVAALVAAMFVSGLRGGAGMAAATGTSPVRRAQEH